MGPGSSDLPVGLRRAMSHPESPSSSGRKEFGIISGPCWFEPEDTESASRQPLQGADLNHRRTRTQLSLAVVIIPQPLSDRWHCGISDFMAGHLSYPISFPI